MTGTHEGRGEPLTEERSAAIQREHREKIAEAMELGCRIGAQLTAEQAAAIRHVTEQAENWWRCRRVTGMPTIPALRRLFPSAFAAPAAPPERAPDWVTANLGSPPNLDPDRSLTGSSAPAPAPVLGDAREVIEALLQNLPDAIGEMGWAHAWNELSDQGQELVKAARAKAIAWLDAHPKRAQEPPSA